VDQVRQERRQVDAALMLLVRRQRRPASASCAGLQSRQLHADAGPAGGGQAVVADEPAGKTREDRRQGRVPWPLRHLPDGRGRSAEGIVPGSLAADRRTATKTGPGVATGGADASSRRKDCAWNFRKNGQIARPDVVRDRRNAGNTAQPTYGFPATPPSAIVHAVPEFIWGMSASKLYAGTFHGPQGPTQGA
jgi:hypothetical protein